MNFDQVKQYVLNNLWQGENRRELNFSNILQQHSFEEIAIAGLVMPQAGRVWGIDISHWNLPPVDLSRMRDVYNLSFVIIKGCDGSLRSRYSTEHVATANATGLPWGFYDWLYPGNRVSIPSQTDAWAAQAHEFHPPMGIFIDAEWTRYAGQAANPSATDLRAAHIAIRNKYFRPATTYTAKGYADQYLRGFDWTQEEFWVASYGGSAPLMPLGAVNHKFWQFTGMLDGRALDGNGNAELDGDYWNGTLDEFNTRYGIAGTPFPTGPVKVKTIRVFSDGSILEI